MTGASLVIEDTPQQTIILPIAFALTKSSSTPALTSRIAALEAELGDSEDISDDADEDDEDVNGHEESSRADIAAGASRGKRRKTDAAVEATDADLPAQPLTYRLVSGPTGLTVTTNGLLSWTPTQQQGPSTNRVRVSVSDPFTSATQDFDILVRDSEPTTEAATLEISSNPGGGWNLRLRATSGVSYQIEQSTSLGGTWTQLPGVTAVVGKSLSEAVTIPLPNPPATNLFLRARRL